MMYIEHKYIVDSISYVIENFIPQYKCNLKKWETDLEDLRRCCDPYINIIGKPKEEFDMLYDKDIVSKYNQDKIQSEWLESIDSMCLVCVLNKDIQTFEWIINKCNSNKYLLESFEETQYQDVSITDHLCTDLLGLCLASNWLEGTSLLLSFGQAFFNIETLSTLCIWLKETDNSSSTTSTIRNQRFEDSEVTFVKACLLNPSFIDSCSNKYIKRICHISSHFGYFSLWKLMYETCLLRNIRCDIQKCKNISCKSVFNASNYLDQYELFSDSCPTRIDEEMKVWIKREEFKYKLDEYCKTLYKTYVEQIKKCCYNCPIDNDCLGIITQYMNPFFIKDCHIKVSKQTFINKYLVQEINKKKALEIEHSSFDEQEVLNDEEYNCYKLFCCFSNFHSLSKSNNKNKIENKDVNKVVNKVKKGIKRERDLDFSKYKTDDKKENEEKEERKEKEEIIKQNYYSFIFSEQTFKNKFNDQYIYQKNEFEDLKKLNI